MRKALLAGLLGLATGGGLLVMHPASALYNDSNCSSGFTPVASAGPVTVGTENSGPTGVVVCADGIAPGTFDGGGLEAGVSGANGPTRLCLPNGQGVPVPLPGVYAIADGDTGNQANLRGYAGLSSYESTPNGPNETCPLPLTNYPPAGGPNNGGGTNSGGAFGVDGVGAAPVPLIVCGSQSGTSYANTGRDGCYAP